MNSPRDRRHRLRTAMLYAAARRAAYATGSGLAAAVLWWITHHAHA